MTAHVLRGSKNEIAETMARLPGDVREAIVFVEEPTECASRVEAEDIFLEMESFTVKAGGADYSRQSLYTPMVGE